MSVSLLDKIDKFEGEHAFLSNFYMHEIVYEGIKFPSSEHAYQAAKTLNMNDRIKCSKLKTPGESKKFGRNIELRPDWEQVKIGVMYDILQIKFSNRKLSNMLVITGDAELIEGNWWGDTFWGICKGKGKNVLGKLLMKLREQIQA